MQAQLAPVGVPLEHIVPFYQPIYSLSDYHVVRYECLARFLDFQQQAILPSEFLYIVEQNQDSAHMTARILALSTAYCCPRNMSWSINLFDTDLHDTQLFKSIRHLCDESPKDLCGVELHFKSASKDLAALAKLCKDNPKMHITVDEIDNIDETLYALSACGVNALKIKASLIQTLSQSQDGIRVLQKLKLKCEESGCKLIAEHIENEAMLAAVKSVDILYGQGFYLSEPVSRVTARHNA